MSVTARMTSLWVGSVVAVFLSISCGRIRTTERALFALLALFRQHVLSIVQRFPPLVSWILFVVLFVRIPVLSLTSLLVYLD